MLDLNVLAELTDEADMFVAFARSARCCDALEPCHGCAVLRRDIAARRRVVIVPAGHAGAPADPSPGPGHLHLVAPLDEVSLAG